MSEDFLHFIWQYQYFDMQDLCTTEGGKVQIIDKGCWNTDAGADFLYAKVIIDGITWAGTIEIHLRSSDWK